MVLAFVYDLCYNDGVFRRLIEIHSRSVLLARYCRILQFTKEWLSIMELVLTITLACT